MGDLDGPLRNAAPIGATGGFPDRQPPDFGRQKPPAPEPSPSPPDGDAVDLHLAAQITRRLLRERVLARTRHRLELGAGEFVPDFAEVLDDEPLSTFVGRLLGAQNQLAALRARSLGAADMRERLDRALREGTAEVLEMLAEQDADHGAAAAVVADVLAEYGRRLALLAGDRRAR